jgi:hypothetical protein
MNAAWLAVSLASLFAVPGPLEDVGVVFRSYIGGFEARFPDAPEEHAFVHKGKSGRELSVQRGHLRFLLIWYDHFPEADRAKGIVLRSEIDGVARGSQARLEEVPASLAGLPGRAFHGSDGDRFGVRGWVGMRGTRVFLLAVAGAEAQVDAAAEPFLGSFSLRGEGVKTAAVMDEGRRVAIEGAGVSIELHGDLERRGSALAARSRGGLRIESAKFNPERLSEPERSRELEESAEMVPLLEPGMVEVGAPMRAGLRGREFRGASGEGETYLRVVVLETGVLILRFQGIAGAVREEDAAAFFESLQVSSAARNP